MKPPVPLSLRWSCLVLLLALVAVGSSGCATSEPDNMSARPWNSPKGWENGIPGFMNEGR